MPDFYTTEQKVLLVWKKQEFTHMQFLKLDAISQQFVGNNTDQESSLSDNNNHQL